MATNCVCKGGHDVRSLCEIEKQLRVRVTDVV